MNATTDWYDVERIDDGTYMTTEGEGVLPCHTYLIEDGDEALLIDTGTGIGDLRAFVKEVVDPDVKVLLTHSHWDHIGAAHQFDDVSINGRERADDGHVAIDILSDEFVERPGQFVANYRNAGKEFPDDFTPDAYTIDPVHEVKAVAPGDELNVGERTLELVATPGHSPGQLAVLDRTGGICHGADVLEPGGEIYAHFQDSDVDAYLDTIDRLVALRNEGAFEVLTTGHGDPIRGDDLSVLDDVRSALDSAANDDAPFDIVDTNWGPTRKYSVAGVDVLISDS